MALITLGKLHGDTSQLSFLQASLRPFYSLHHSAGILKWEMAQCEATYSFVISFPSHPSAMECRKRFPALLQVALHAAATQWLKKVLPRTTRLLPSYTPLVARLQDLLGKFCENCVYLSIAPHLRKPKIRNMCTNFSQPAKDGLKFNVMILLKR